MPADLYYCYIDPHYNNWTAAKVLNNKALFGQLFGCARQPEVIARRVNGFWTDAAGTILTGTMLEKIVSRCECMVVKQATEDENGTAIAGGTEKIASFNKVCGAISKDIVVHAPVNQHESMEKLCPGTMNTVRVLSRLTQNGVEIISAVVRMGNGLTDGGVVACGIQQDGQLKENAFTYKGDKTEVHPVTGIRYADCKVPNYSGICALVDRAHTCVPSSRLVSWDVAIDALGLPVLMGANLSYGDVNLHQLCNGPIFGDKTDEILQEVFHVRGDSPHLTP